MSFTISKRSNDARQGVTGHKVRYVLFWSMSMVIILFALLWLHFFS